MLSKRARLHSAAVSLSWCARVCKSLSIHHQRSLCKGCTRPAMLGVSHQNGRRTQHNVRPCEPDTLGNKCIGFPVTIKSSPAQRGCPARTLLRSAGEGCEALPQLAMTEWPDCTQSCYGHACPHQAGRLDPPRQHSLQRTPCGAWGSLGTTCLPECHTALPTCIMIRLFLAAKENGKELELKQDKGRFTGAQYCWCICNIRVKAPGY